jgi:hypothetical protein
MKFWLGVFTTLLVVAPIPVIVTHYETVVQEVEVQPERVDTPILDSLVKDWDEVERQSDCLFLYLQEHLGYDITLEAVIHAGAWLDILGGPCLVIGEDDGD